MSLLQVRRERRVALGLAARPPKLWKLVVTLIALLMIVRALGQIV